MDPVTPETSRWICWPDGTEVPLEDFREEEWRHKSDDFEIVEKPVDYDRQ